MDPDREWWLRVPAVLLSPRSVFAALRSEEREDVEARAEPVLALTLLAGIAIALGTSTARSLYDDPLYDPLTLAVWAVLAGGFVAFAGYFIVGGALYLGARGLGGLGTFRRARHVLGFAVAPLHSRRFCSGRSACSSSGQTSSNAAVATTASGGTCSTRPRLASRSGRQRSCCSASASSTAGAGPGRLAPSGWSCSS